MEITLKLQFVYVVLANSFSFHIRKIFTIEKLLLYTVTVSRKHWE